MKLVCVVLTDFSRLGVLLVVLNHRNLIMMKIMIINLGWCAGKEKNV